MQRSMDMALDDDDTTDVEGGQQTTSNEEQPSSSPPRVSFQNEDANNDNNNDDNDDTSSSQDEPLYHSSRLKGYMTLFVSALYNYMAAVDQKNGVINDKFTNLCLEMDDLGNFVEREYNDLSRLRYTMACSMITIIITGAIILCHFDFCTPLRKKVWPKAFGPHGKVELWILLFLTIFWMVSTWFNTTIRGPGGEGKEQYNLYFSSWLCTWSSMWTLERWCTCTGRASFERFVRSWPNRCPLWIVTFILSFVDFMFVLDTSTNWNEGARFTPYVLKLYSEVERAEWTLLFVTTIATFTTSLAWALAEIFRENVNNKYNVKSDVEFYVEGISIHILSLIWIVTICIVTMPGGAASLLGNLYFTTWSTLFSVIGTLIWYVRDWRQMILDVIEEKEQEYELVKKTLRRREEVRRARLKEKEREEMETEIQHEENKTEESVVLCEDDPDVDDDITISISSGVWRGKSSVKSVTASPDRSRKKEDELAPPQDIVASSLFMSALSFLWTGPDVDVDDDEDK